jgi:hypothetical protein
MYFLNEILMITYTSLHSKGVIYVIPFVSRKQAFLCKNFYFKNITICQKIVYNLRNMSEKLHKVRLD